MSVVTGRREHDRLAQVAAGQAREVVDELLEERAVQAELLAHVGDGLGRSRSRRAAR